MRDTLAVERLTADLLETDALTPNNEGTPTEYTVDARNVQYLVETVLGFALEAGWQPPTEPTAERAGDAECARVWPDCYSGGYDPRCCRFPKSCSAERAGDADDVATVLAQLRQYRAEHPTRRVLLAPHEVDALLAAQSAAVPDRAEVDALRAAVEAFCETLESEDDYVRSWKCARQLRAALGDQADRIEETP